MLTDYSQINPKKQLQCVDLVGWGRFPIFLGTNLGTNLGIHQIWGRLEVTCGRSLLWLHWRYRDPTWTTPESSQATDPVCILVQLSRPRELLRSGRRKKFVSWSKMENGRLGWWQICPQICPQKDREPIWSCGMPDHKRNFWRENLPLDKRIANKILYPLSLCRHHAKTLCNINYVKAKLTFRS